MKPRKFKSHKEIDIYLNRIGYNKQQAEAEGWQFISNDEMELEIINIAEPDCYRPMSCSCIPSEFGQNLPCCISCFESGYKYAPPAHPVFKSDTDAVDFVFHKALQGSVPHKMIIKTNFGSDIFYPYAAIHYTKTECLLFHYCKTKTQAVRKFRDLLRDIDCKPEDEIIEIGCLQYYDNRVVLVSGYP